jgi:hypothetical protein
MAGGGSKSGDSGAPSIDTQDSVVTAEQAANFAIKEGQAAQFARRCRADELFRVLTASGEGGPPPRFVLDTRPRQHAKCSGAARRPPGGHQLGAACSSSTNLNGVNAASNWKKQSTLCGLDGTK